MNFCRDCKHMRRPDQFPERLDLAGCSLAIESEHGPDYPVTGVSKPKYKFCTVARMQSQPCGPDGLLFEVDVPPAPPPLLQVKAPPDYERILGPRSTFTKPMSAGFDVLGDQGPDGIRPPPESTL